jgi:stage II sporulation protein GA (sporulation sigma-E factor processing peptidase)
MVQVVYVDVLFAINLILNYLILLAVSNILHRKDSKVRLLAGAAAGALYSLLIFFPELGFLFTAISKILFSMLIVFISYKIGHIRQFIRLLLFFYAVSLLFGGIIFAVYLFLTPPGMYIHNGVLYYDISPLVLILSAGGCYIAMMLFARLLHRKDTPHAVYPVEIWVNDRNVRIQALYDTGNALCDQVTGSPVMIAEYGKVEKLLPVLLRSAYREGRVDGIYRSEGSDWAGRVRVVPIRSVAAAASLLPAFRPDRIMIQTKERKIETDRVLIAVCGKPLSDDGSFSALLNPHLFEEIRG